MQKVLPKPSSGSPCQQTKSLSSIEDKELRKKLRNRQSALAARERKKARMLQLEKAVNELQHSNARLNEENSKLRQLLDTSHRAKTSDQAVSADFRDKCEISYETQQRASLKSPRVDLGSMYTNNTCVSAEHSPNCTDNFAGANGTLKTSTNDSYEHRRVSLDYPPTKRPDATRKRSVHLPTTSQHVNGEEYAVSHSNGLSEKRRKSCPGYGKPFTLDYIYSKEETLMESTSQTSISNFLPNAGTYANNHNTPYHPSSHSLGYQSVGGTESQEAYSATTFLSSDISSLPSIDMVLGCQGSSQEGTALYNPSQWENSDVFYPHVPPLHHQSHHVACHDRIYQWKRRNAVTSDSSGYCSNGFIDSVESTSNEAENIKRTMEVSFHHHRQCDAAKSYNDSVGWIM